jgi:hypothetical protein
MPARGTGKFQKTGQSQLRQQYNVLKAVRKTRNKSAPTWNDYVRVTKNGRRDYGSK